MKVKTIDIQAKEWSDKINGNSYFASKIIVNKSLKNEKRYVLPFQYGYENVYEQKAIELLKKNGLIKETSVFKLKNEGVIIRSQKQRNCLKKEVVNFGKL